MDKFIQYVQEFQENNEKGLYFIKHILPKYEGEIIEDSEVEHILDYLYSNQKLDVTIIGYKTIKEKADKRNKKLQNIKVKDDSDGIECVLDFGDGFKFVKLISKESYDKEGKIMSHCVASYYGKPVEIYSLRDSNNNPHCTIESGNQIKGKGNGKIDPKYIDYVVRFLEFKGMNVRDSEMRNLGYYKLDNIDKGLSCDTGYKGYVFEGNLEKIKDEDGDLYYGMGLINIKDILEVSADLKFKIIFDISKLVKYFVSKINQSGTYAKLAASGDSAKLAASGDSAKLAASGDSAKLAASGAYAQLAASGNSAKLDIQGEKGVAANIGYNGIIKGVKGTWITLAEYDENYHVKYVKTGQIDGVKIKENTRYKLENKKFVELKN